MNMWGKHGRFLPVFSGFFNTFFDIKVVKILIKGGYPLVFFRDTFFVKIYRFFGPWNSRASLEMGKNRLLGFFDFSHGLAGVYVCVACRKNWYEGVPPTIIFLCRLLINFWHCDVIAREFFIKTCFKISTYANDFWPPFGIKMSCIWFNHGSGVIN